MSPVRPSFPHFTKSRKQNNFQVKIVVATSGTVGLAEWIIDDILSVLYLLIYCRKKGEDSRLLQRCMNKRE